MIQKKSVIGAAAFFLVAALTVGYFAIAADIGSKENPLVTLDYIKTTLDPQIESAIDQVVREKVDSRMSEINDMLAQANEQIAEMLANGGGGGDASVLAGDEEFISKVAEQIASKIGTSSGEGVPGVSSKVKVETGKTLNLPMGASVMLRLGSGTVVASGTPGLIDLTTGETLENGNSLQQNHLYTVTVETGGRSIKCTSEMTVFVWGTYTIS